MKDQMTITHEGKEYTVKQYRKCDECGKEFYILIFDLRLPTDKSATGCADCPHCQNEQIVTLMKTGI